LILTQTSQLTLETWFISSNCT